MSKLTLRELRLQIGKEIHEAGDEDIFSASEIVEIMNKSFLNLGYEVYIKDVNVEVGKGIILIKGNNK